MLPEVEQPVWQVDSYLTILEQTVEHRTVCLANAAKIKSTHLGQILILVVWSDAAKEIDVLC